MKIVFDCRYVGVDQHDGVSRYSAGLMTALAALHPVTMLVSDRRQLARLPDVAWQLVCSPTSVRELAVARDVRRLRPDVVFSPMQTMGSWGRRCGLVLTLHDLIFYRSRTPPPQFAAWLRLLWRLYHLAWWPQRILLNRADALVAVSATTAALIAQHHLTRRAVTVVPNAPDRPDAVPPPTRKPRTRALVYMGSFMPYKNVATLVEAMAALPEHELHLMSPVPAHERTRLKTLAGGGRLVFHDGAPDDVYREVLGGATALVSASRDEGFGLPLVEAMVLGTPMVVSDIAAFREVAGDAATYVAPDNAAGFVEAVRELDEPGRWAERSAASYRRAGHYSLAESARTPLSVLEQVAAERTVSAPRRR